MRVKFASKYSKIIFRFIWLQELRLDGDRIAKDAPCAACHPVAILLPDLVIYRSDPAP